MLNIAGENKLLLVCLPELTDKYVHFHLFFLLLNNYASNKNSTQLLASQGLTKPQQQLAEHKLNTNTFEYFLWSISENWEAICATPLSKILYYSRCV